MDNSQILKQVEEAFTKLNDLIDNVEPSIKLRAVETIELLTKRHEDIKKSYELRDKIARVRHSELLQRFDKLEAEFKGLEERSRVRYEYLQELINNVSKKVTSVKYSNLK